MENLGLHTWHDFVTTAARRLTENPISGRASSITREPSPSWDGNLGFPAAVAMAKSGWQDGVKDIALSLDKLPIESDVLPDWQMSAAGVMCVVPAFVAGEPECMLSLTDCSQTDRRVIIAVPGVFNSDIDAKDVMKFAIALAAVTRYLEGSGVDVAIYSVSTSRVTIETVYGIVIKDLGEPLDLSKIAFAFHPAFLRRIGFAWREITPAACAANLSGQLYGRYGASVGVRSDHMEMLLGTTGTPIAIVRGFTPNGLNTGETVDYYIDAIKEDIQRAAAT